MTNTEIKQAINTAKCVFVNLGHVAWPVRIDKSEAHDLMKYFKVVAHPLDKGEIVELDVSYRDKN